MPDRCSNVFFSTFSFYRYVLEPEISFTAENNFAPGPIAKFLDMPQSPLFTLNLNTPESWMVESVRTPYDLDNIFLEEVREIIMFLLHLDGGGFPGLVFLWERHAEFLNASKHRAVDITPFADLKMFSRRGSISSLNKQYCFLISI